MNEWLILVNIKFLLRFSYDEAFPPLSDSCCDELTFFAASAGSQDNLVAAGRDETEPSGVKWPTDRKERRTWGYQGRLSDSSNSSGTSVASVVSATPSKKLKCENEAGKQSTVATHTSRNPPLTRKQPHHRPLNSCPDFLQHQNFCQPHRHQIAKAPLQSSSFSFPAYPDGVKTGVSPYFVVPKCRKTSPVSSCGSGKQRKRHWSGGGKSGKSHGVEQLKSFALAIDNNNSGPTSIFNQNQLHTEDVPAWQQCNEWVCPVHRGAEFHFWSARIGGLGEVACRSCAKPPSQDGIFSCDEDAMEIGASPSLQQSDGFNSPEGSTNTSATGSYGSGGGINMFDAPQFILHIINEDSSSSPPPATSQDTGNMPTSFKEAANDLQWSAAAEEASVDKWGDNGTKLDSAAVWGTGDKEGLAPEFTFNVIREKFSSPYDNVANQPVSFCLPKFSTIQSNSGDGQYGGQQSNTLSQLFSLVGMANGNYPGAQQSLPPGLSTLLPILSEQLMKGSKVELSPVKTQPPPPPPPQQQQQQQPQPTFYQSQQQVPKIAEEKRQPVKVPAIPVSPQTHFVPIRSESMEDAYYPKPGFDEVNTWISPEGYHTLQQPVGKTNWRSLSLKFKVA